MILAALVGIALTEQSLVAVIVTAGTILAALITAFGSAFVVLANRARKSAAHAAGSAAIAAHEARPNSGSTQRDSVNRIEAMVKTLVLDTGHLKRDVSGLRAENLQDRASAADDRRAAETRDIALGARITHLEQKGPSS